MPRFRVPVFGSIGKAINIDSSANEGATIGVDLKLADGSVPSLAELIAVLSRSSDATPASERKDAVNVLDFGARADDLTDNYGAIEAALDEAAASLTRKKVYFPAGVYRTSDRHVLTAARTGITICGEGYNSVIRLAGTYTSNKGLFTIPADGDNDGGTADGADDITISNIRIDGSLATMTSGVSSGIRCFHGVRHKFTDLFVHDFELSGILLQSIHATNDYSVLVDRVHSYNNDDGTSTGQGIGIEAANVNTARISIANSFLYDNGGVNYGRGLNVGSGSAFITNTQIWGNGGGAMKLSGNDEQHVVLSNCDLSNNPGTTAQGFSTTGTFGLVEFVNVRLENNGDHGLEIGHVGKVILNNILTKDNGDIGLYIDAAADVQIGTAMSQGNTNQGIRFASGCRVQAGSLWTKENGNIGVQIVTNDICHINSIVSENDCQTTGSDAVSVQPASTGLDLWIGAVNATDSGTSVTDAVNLVNSNIDRAIIGKITTDSITDAIDGAAVNTIRYDDIYGEDTWDPGSIADGDEVATDITVTGAVLGDWAIASISRDVQDLTLSATVTTADTVTVVLANNTGAAVDLGSSTVRCRVMKRLPG